MIADSLYPNRQSNHNCSATLHEGAHIIHQPLTSIGKPSGRQEVLLKNPKGFLISIISIQLLWKRVELTTLGTNLDEVKGECQETSNILKREATDIMWLDILFLLIGALQKNEHIVAITEKLSQMTNTVSMKRISAAKITNIFLNSLVINYCPQDKLVVENSE